MTAEVAVMNRIGVALAADSAVTVGHDAQKIYTSAEKMFQLSIAAPVGVMVYGNANFVNLPWETVIKSYRRLLGSSRLPSIDGYARGFFEYLTNNLELFPPSSQERQIRILAYSLFVSIREQIKQAIDKAAENQPDGLTQDQLPGIIESVVNERQGDIAKSNRIKDVDDEFVQSTETKLASFIGEVITELFGSLPFTEGAKQGLIRCAVEMLTRQYFWPLKSGLVIAGFGEKEYLPSLLSYELEEMVYGIPRMKPSFEHQVTHESDACIMPFAQQESVHHFLEGVDKSLANFMKGSANTVVTGAIDAVLQKIAQIDQQMSDQLGHVVRPEIQKMLAGLFDEWEDRKRAYWQPVIDIVSVLPKDELAAIAEALVNLTKFRRRVTPERETVGGPIDVAVITKGDGFVWMRRKHYFDPSLNPRIVARFGREI